MPISLKRRATGAPTFDRWLAIDIEVGLPDSANRLNLSAHLEQAFDDEASTWLTLAKRLGANPSAGLSHFAAATPNNSDFGSLLAWSRVVAELAAEAPTTLVLCNDPWLFRHLATLPGVDAEPPPPLWPKRAAKFLRGYVARTQAATRLIGWHLALRAQARRAPNGEPAIMVYGHPRSRPDGFDGYFGDLMEQIPEITRFLHVDCPPARARAMAAGGRSFSLHAWGSVLAALALPFAKWRPTRAERGGEFEWLLDRARTMEGGTGQAATIAWQRHCQKRWLAGVRPSAVAWPWENQSWERQFVRDAKTVGVATIGYQHVATGSQMLNLRTQSNADGLASIPDRVVTTGSAMVMQLQANGLPTERIVVGGAFRFPAVSPLTADPAGPVFLALPFERRLALEIIEAARKLTDLGLHFLAKEHPMAPLRFKETSALRKTDKGFADHRGLRVVVYAATSVGLEAMMAGLPTLRFRSNYRVAIDILPADIDAPATDAEGLGEAIAGAKPPAPIERRSIFADVDPAVWRRAFA